MNIFTSLPPLSGLTKIVSSASPRFRFSIEERGRDQIAAVLGPALGLEIRSEFGADALHVRLALEDNVLNKLLVLDVGRIFCESQILDVEFILRRLGRGFFAELSRRLGGLGGLSVASSSGFFESAT